MFAGKPIIGIVGGIGSGKSHVARIFGEEGCLVIDSDELVSRAYKLEAVRNAVRSWWGEAVIDEQGDVNRAAIARRVFAEAAERRRLESLLHPIVGEMREAMMRQGAKDACVVAYVWDTPLLIEAGLSGRCDAVVFVDAPVEERMRRVQATRGWSEEEWRKREKSQLPLDRKREIANYMVRNTADADDGVRDQVREVLSRILAGTADREG